MDGWMDGIYSTEFHKIGRKGGIRATEETIRLWWYSGSRYVRVRFRVRVGWGVDHGGVGSLTLDPLKICRRGQSMFWPPKLSHSFIHNCCWITLHVSRYERWKTCVENGAWNSSMAWPDWPRPHYFTTDLCGEGRVMVIRLDGGRAIPLHTGFIGAAESYPATLILGMLYLAFVLRDQWPRRRYTLYRVPF